MATTTNGGAFTVTRESMRIDPDGNVSLSLRYVGSGGNVVTERQLMIPVNAAQPITDQFGNHITATVPAALATAIASFLSEIDTEIAAGASAGKLNL